MCAMNKKIQNLSREIETIKESNGKSIPKNAIPKILKYAR